MILTTGSCTVGGGGIVGMFGSSEKKEKKTQFSYCQPVQPFCGEKFLLMESDILKLSRNQICILDGELEILF